MVEERERAERETEAEIGTETCPTMHQSQVCWELSMVAIDGLSSAEKGWVMVIDG